MEIARVVLDYLKVLVWPAVTISALLIFRAQIREIASRLNRAAFLGLEIEATAREVSAAIEAAAADSEQDPALAAESEAVQRWLRPEQPLSDLAPQRETDEAINLLERAVRRLAWETDVSLLGQSTRKAAQGLIDQGMLSPSFFRALDDLLTIRDVERGRPRPDSHMRELARQATQLRLVLATAEQARNRTRVVGDTAG